MTDETTFPLPADVEESERATLRREIARYATLLGEDARGLRFAGAQIGQTGPVHHFQYIRLYRVAEGFLAIGHDLREGMEVTFAKTAEELPDAFAEETVREFVEDELRYRGVLPRGAPAGSS